MAVEKVSEINERINGHPTGIFKPTSGVPRPVSGENGANMCRGLYRLNLCRIVSVNQNHIISGCVFIAVCDIVCKVRTERRMPHTPISNSFISFTS